MLYMFLLTIWTADSPMTQVYVEDVQLSGADCIDRIAAYDRADPTHSRGTPSCELDFGLPPFVELLHNGQAYVLPPCEYEDSRNCFWDAAYQGNGRGESFYDIDGRAYPLN